MTGDRQVIRSSKPRKRDAPRLSRTNPCAGVWKNDLEEGFLVLSPGWQRLQVTAFFF